MFGLFCNQSGVDVGIDGVCEVGWFFLMVEVESGVYQNGIFGLGWGVLVCIVFWKLLMVVVVSVSVCVLLRLVNCVVYLIFVISLVMLWRVVWRVVCLCLLGLIMCWFYYWVLVCGNVGWCGVLDRCCLWESFRCFFYLLVGVVDCWMVQKEFCVNRYLCESCLVDSFNRFFFKQELSCVWCYLI